MFKELAAAEALATELEQECDELAQQLRDKANEYEQAQLAVLRAQAKYDEAAKHTQVEVQKLRPKSANDKQHIADLMRNLDPDALEEVASSMVAAAKAARSQVHGTPTVSPKPSPPSFPQGSDVCGCARAHKA